MYACSSLVSATMFCLGPPTIQSVKGASPVEICEHCGQKSHTNGYLCSVLAPTPPPKTRGPTHWPLATRPPPPPHFDAIYGPNQMSQRGLKPDRLLFPVGWYKLVKTLLIQSYFKHRNDVELAAIEARLLEARSTLTDCIAIWKLSQHAYAKKSDNFIGPPSFKHTHPDICWKT